MSVLNQSIPNTEHLAVIGEATFQVQPDIAEIRVALRCVLESQVTAKTNVDTRSANIITLARSLGLESADIRASQLTLTPNREFRNGETHNKGYAAERLITLTLRNLAQFNQLVGGLVAIPIDRIVGINTKVTDVAGANQAALKLAVDDAKNRAKFLADQFGVRLGDVFSIRAVPKEERFPGAEMARGGGSSGDAAFEPGMIDIKSHVEVTYYLEKR